MKQQLRKQILQKRNTLTRKEVLEKSMKIQHHLMNFSWYQEAMCILFYVSFHNEVHTHEMIQESLKNGKHVVVPKTDCQNKELILSTLSCWDDLCSGSYSILEPRDDCIKKVPLTSIDLCIIPGVVFDSQGNRIGHGGGYYDRLFQMNSQAHRLGLAYELQIVPSIPIEAHDIKVEKIITEKRIIDCS
jgi:5-formyltetrahydrofolate cyclo-ligase